MADHTDSSLPVKIPSDNSSLFYLQDCSLKKIIIYKIKGRVLEKGLPFKGVDEV